jgi:DNA/RNA endonuclease YhcR with UshA esterase domain
MLVLCIGMLVGCGNTGLNAAVDNLKQLHKDIPTLTPSDYEVVSKLTINGAEYTVDWSVNVTEGVTIVKAENGTVTVDVNEYAESDIAYTLTAKVTAADGKSETLTFNHTVPTFKELTWAEYMAKADDEAVIVKGVLTAIIKGSNKTHLNFQDADGGYYAYNVKNVPENLAVGMTVRVTGLRDTYNGGAQIAAGCTVEILDTTITEVAPLDITEAVLAADGFQFLYGFGSGGDIVRRNLSIPVDGFKLIKVQKTGGCFLLDFADAAHSSGLLQKTIIINYSIPG